MAISRRARHWTPLLLTAAAVLGTAPACRSASRGATDQSAEVERATREAIQNERAIDPATFPPSTLGVTPLRVSASDTLIEPLGYGLADLLLADLARSAQLQVVDRLRVDVLLRETALGQSGAVDPATAPRVGRLLGARRLVVGGLTQLPSGGLRLDA
ncbi:MAG TPA: CsgG/HfaB family protein, partial [Gemmatimonadaceae bacterium]|nr:CsgG/HfaB family protein [Gemmatimonadaceae bacterium]